jgi:cysteine dioxygenase
MKHTLNGLFAELDRRTDRIGLDELTKLLGEVDEVGDELDPFVHFDDSGYQRNLVRRGRAYEALLLCWKSGQRSAIHDHRSSSCGVLVVKGTATETVFKRSAEGWIIPAGTAELPAGGVCGSNDMDTHQISNLQPGGAELITLHIYSPPLREVGQYSLEDNSVELVRNDVNTGPIEVAAPTT